jgi:hypothetical protein
MWFELKRIERLMGAALAGEISPGERDELERALARRPELQAEFNAMERLLERVPRTRPELGTDLAPAIRSSLAAERPAPRFAFRPRYALAAAASLAALTALWYGVVSAPTAHAPAQGQPQQLAAGTPMQNALREAESLAAQNLHDRAYEVLAQAVQRQPDDPDAAAAQWQLADLAFDLGWYPRAHDAYQRLFANYRTALHAAESARRERALLRRDLLEEGNRNHDFQALYAFDLARHDRGNPVASLERVASENQGSLVAELAVDEMAQIVLAENGTDYGALTAPSQGVVAALKEARSRCGEPYVVALIDCKIGDLYRHVLRDPTSARNHYLSAEKNQVLASRARKALAALESPAAPAAR